MITWIWRTFSELTSSDLYEILALREQVFILEQHCFYTDLDYKDQHALHLLGIQENKIVAYLRLFPKEVIYPDAMSFGRVIVEPSMRGKGVGKKLMDETIKYLHKHQMHDPIIISAQIYLEKFYQSYGFITISEPYDDAGVMHIDMIKN